MDRIYILEYATKMSEYSYDNNRSTSVYFSNLKSLNCVT